MKIFKSRRAHSPNQTLNRLFVVSVFLLFVGGLIASFGNPAYAYSGLKHFTSKDDIKQFIQNNRMSYSNNGLFSIGMMKAETTSVQSLSADSARSSGASDYSTTNVQVEGVDEGDFVKNDGKYIYMIKGNELVIVEAYPAEDAEVVSKTSINGTPTQIYLNGDRLAVTGTRGSYDKETINGKFYQNYYNSNTFIYVYDIYDKEEPRLENSIEIQGNYVNSRMIGKYVYAVVQERVNYPDVQLPEIKQEGEEQEIQPGDIEYIEYPDYGYSYTHVAALDITLDDAQPEDQVYLLGTSVTIYASQENLYLTHQIRGNMEKGVGELGLISTEKTAIHKISLNKEMIGYKGKGEVPGHILNQFSMDEFDGNFRIATTIGQVSRNGAGSTNNVYVLDEGLNVIGRLENLAPGEKIYSARFMGEKGYLVTFKKVDPLFVIDLSNPANPKVLGELKIPGYSDYLQPYDENHIIGIGKDAVEAEEGNFAWYQGIKVALFDVSDVENPKEIDNMVIGDRGTDSEALRDHKAVLFSKDKNLLVLPISLYEISQPEYYEDGNGEPVQRPGNTYGQFVWQGAYALKISPEEGISVAGKITHADSDV